MFVPIGSNNRKWDGKYECRSICICTSYMYIIFTGLFVYSDRLRPLWPALGIVGVGIVVALFIIIGHFVDKAIEKTQTDPFNPSKVM